MPPAVPHRTCFTNYTSLMDALVAGECDMALGGIQVTTDMLRRNVSFSWPTFAGGKTIAVAVGESATDPWVRLRAQRRGHGGRARRQRHLTVAPQLAPPAVALPAPSCRASGTRCRGRCGWPR